MKFGNLNLAKLLSGLPKLRAQRYQSVCDVINGLLLCVSDSQNGFQDSPELLRGVRGPHQQADQHGALRQLRLSGNGNISFSERYFE